MKSGKATPTSAVLWLQYATTSTKIKTLTRGLVLQKPQGPSSIKLLTWDVSGCEEEVGTHAVGLVHSVGLFGNLDDTEHNQYDLRLTSFIVSQTSFDF
ncbi:hypothetical protein NDU88_002654 [Pleurodeles waltl]|uniref:Uncharacterized protein n=1 Tax=Pleurodeles waltl TaxID=8319 RepID=A0AAV7P7A7_PLEWA|nr:hypothetical protein NDU88_002654 [Pleurodeles waltl]